MFAALRFAVVLLQVREEDNTTISTATKASAVLLARVAHDSSVILYWPADGE